MQPNLTMVLEQVGKDKDIDEDRPDQTLEQAILTAAKTDFGMHREMEAQVQRGDRRASICSRSCNVVEGPTADRRAARSPSRAAPSEHGLEAELGDELLFQIFYRRRGRRPAPRSRTRSTATCSTCKHAHARRSAASPRRPPSRSSSSACARPSARTSSTSTRTARASSSPASSAASSAATLIVDLGGAEAVLPVREQVPRESLPRRRPHHGLRARHRQERARAADHPVAHAQGPAREAVREEVPEIYEKIVRIEASAREPGARAKIAVSARATATSIRSAPASA